MNFASTNIQTIVPTKIIEPVKIRYNAGDDELISIPMATFEKPVWYATKRGALVSCKTEGIAVSVIDDVMARSIILEANDLATALKCKDWIENNFAKISHAILASSRFAILKDIHIENVGRLLFVRFAMSTGNASGHNMSTKATDVAANLIVAECEDINYLSVSGNYCVDKKVSSINGILGRGKRATAEIIVPRDVCLHVLKSTPEKIVNLCTKKNLLGSILSGGVRTANAHFANVALAIYLATGQDAANIVEASQGITFADFSGNDLYLSVNTPNLIVGTVGNGKDLDFAINNLRLLKCDPYESRSPQRLAAIICAAMLCAELSLLAALTNSGELVEAHMRLERAAI